MNFYIGDSISTIDINEYNIEFSDDLLNFICENAKAIPCNTNILLKINPYTDTFIPLVNLPQIITICNYLLNHELFLRELRLNEWTQMLTDLVKIVQDAILKGSGLISIGD